MLNFISFSMKNNTGNPCVFIEAFLFGSVIQGTSLDGESSDLDISVKFTNPMLSYYEGFEHMRKSFDMLSKEEYEITNNN